MYIWKLAVQNLTPSEDSLLNMGTLGKHMHMYSTMLKNIQIQIKTFREIIS